MTAPDARDESAAAELPVGYTDARHVALLTVTDGRVRYDRANAEWTLVPESRGSGGEIRFIRGKEQRTLRDLLDRGLITYKREAAGRVRVTATSRGAGALALWGQRTDRLTGSR